MAKIPGLIKRGGRYSLRTHVPQDIIQSFGKREIVTALGTSEHGEATKRAKLKTAEFVRVFEQHRQSLTNAPRNATDGDPAPGGQIITTDIQRLSATLAKAHYAAVRERSTSAIFPIAFAAPRLPIAARVDLISASPRGHTRPTSCQMMSRRVAAIGARPKRRPRVHAMACRGTTRERRAADSDKFAEPTARSQRHVQLQPSPTACAVSGSRKRFRVRFRPDDRRHRKTGEK